MHEAVRELVRSRDAAVDDLRPKRQSISSLMLRHGRAYPAKRLGARVTGNGCKLSDSIMRLSRSSCVAYAITAGTCSSISLAATAQLHQQ
jgi:hypothetical protein